MRRHLLWTCALAIGAMAGATPAQGQEDYRSLDRGRPIRVEDAYPLKFREWEWELGAGVSAAEGGRTSAGGVLGLKTGPAPNWEVGIEAEASGVRAGGAWSGGVESFGASILYNVNQESRRTPAIAFRADLHAPGVGDTRRRDAGGGVGAIATRTLGASRVHLNAGFDWASPTDGGDQWRGGLALDVPIGLQGRLLLADVYLESPLRGSTRWWVEAGTRIQLSATSVLDAGLFTRGDRWADGEANIGLIIGLSRSFGIAGLIDVPPYPNPRLD